MSVNIFANLPERAQAGLQSTVDPDACTVQCAIDMHCAPAPVYAVLADVAGWAKWDPDTRAAAIVGPLKVGATGRLRPRKGLPIKLVVTSLEADRRLSFQAPVLGSGIAFDHIIDATGEGVRVTHRVQFSGWMRAWLMRNVGRVVADGLPVTLTRLRTVCERAVST